MDHWLQGVLTILKAQTSDLRQLANIAGSDAKTFYLGASLAGVDVRGQDLRGIEFSTDQLRQLIIDDSTRLDPRSYPLLRELYENEFRINDFLSEAEILCTDGRYLDAAARLENALELESDNEAVWHRLANTLIKAKEHLRARSVLEALCQRFPRSELGWRRLAQVVKRTDGPEVAASVLRRALKLCPRSAGLSFLLGSMTAEYDLEEGIAIYQEALSKFPEAAHWPKLVRLLGQAGKTTEAIDLAWEAIRRFGWSTTLIRSLEKLLRQSGQLPELAEAYRGYVERNPARMDAHRLLVKVLTEVGRHDEAIRTARRAIDQFPGQIAPYKWLGDALWESGELAETIDVLSEATHQEFATTSAYRWLGRALVATGRIDRAEGIYREAQDRFRDPVAWRWLAELYDRNGDPEAALQTLEQARHIFPDNALTWRWLANALPDRDAARRLLTQAAMKFPSQPTAENRFKSRRRATANK